MSRWKNFRQSHWLMELSPRKNVEPRIVGIRSTFRSSTFFRLVRSGFKVTNVCKSFTEHVLLHIATRNVTLEMGSGGCEICTPWL